MEELLATIGEREGWLAYSILALSAAIEYVFPPFPGDTVTLFGAFLVSTQGWNAFAVMGAVTVGSLAGAIADYYVGVGLGKDPRGRNPVSRFWARALGRIKPLVARLERRGAAYLVVNRFLPGVRAFFFVAAGMARLPIEAVLFYALLSALAWNLAILAAGLAIGESWEALKEAGLIYSYVAYGVMGLLAVGLFVRWIVKRRGTRSRGSRA